MNVKDFWINLKPIFDGHSDEIQEIELISLSDQGMRDVLLHVLHRSTSANFKFQKAGNPEQVILPSPDAVIDHILRGQIVVAMWLTLPALPLLSIYIDFPGEISFGYIRGEWNALAVLAFFDLMYDVVHLSNGAQLRPSIYTFSTAERQAIMDFWQDYQHVAT